MFKNILVPTDGSDLAAKAVEQAVLFAKEIGAKITALTVTEPFHLLSVELSQLEYTPIEYKKHAEAHAEKVLGTVSAAANSAGVACEVLHAAYRDPLSPGDLMALWPEGPPIGGPGRAFRVRNATVP